MRFAFLAALAAALAAEPAHAAGERCPRTPAGDLEAHIERSYEGDARLTRLLVCDHRTGRRRVVRRARTEAVAAGQRRGRSIAAAAAHRRRVAWVEARIVGRGIEATMRIAGAAGRVRTRFVIRHDADGPLGVAYLRDGRLAWVDPGPPTARLLLGGPDGGSPRAVAEGGTYARLAAEDGATLTWEDSAGVGHLDVLPLRRRGGCPRRQRFTTVRSTPEHVVTEAYYRRPDIQLTRVCLRSLGRDPIVMRDGDEHTFGNGDSGEVTGLAGPWATTAVRALSRYHGCLRITVTTVDLRTGTPERAGRDLDCERAPEYGTPQTVTAGGAPAWLKRSDTGDVLLAVRADGTFAELDRGARGTIARLRAAGETFTWTNAGEPRDAPAP